MPIESNSNSPSLTPEVMAQADSSPEHAGTGDNASDDGLATALPKPLELTATLRSQQHQAALTQARLAVGQQTEKSHPAPRASLMTLVAIALIGIGLVLDNFLIGLLGTLLALLLSLAVLWPWSQAVVKLSPQARSLIVAALGGVAALIGLCEFTGVNRRLLDWASQVDWDAVGALGEVIGAVGQILIAIIAVYVAWRQYVISRELTIQQNLLTVQQNTITQQQTIDSYFQGISELVLDEEGLLEDWPQERAIAAGRTAAILSSVDAGGRAKIIRFLSHSNLLTPLERDRRLGRAIFDGSGGYAEDRLCGVRVIDLGVMLSGADLSGTDLRWTDLSEANLVRANLSGCDLVRTNLSRTILYEAQLIGADLKGTHLFYGLVETATPRSRNVPPDYKTGEHTGAVVENADFTDTQRMADSLRCYCCAWGGTKTRATIPGGCEGIPDKLGR